MTWEQEVIRQVQREVELGLIKAIEVIEGRVPTDDEARSHLHCYIYPSGDWKYTWKDIVIVSVKDFTVTRLKSGPPH